MKIALDTNVLAYAEGAGDDTRCASARALLGDLASSEVMIPAQALGELYRVLTGKLKRDAETVRTALLDWSDGYEVAAENRCRLLLSEDLQHGFTWRGVTVINPFEHVAHPLLLAACSSNT